MRARLRPNVERLKKTKRVSERSLRHDCLQGVITGARSNANVPAASHTLTSAVQVEMQVALYDEKMLDDGEQTASRHCERNRDEVVGWGWGWRGLRLGVGVGVARLRRLNQDGVQTFIKES